MQKFDILIVGGGILGAFHAYHAANAGKKVILLEKDAKSAGSTTQNFGQIVPSGLAGQWFDYGLRTLEIYHDLQQIADFSLRPCGSLYLASDAHEAKILAETAEQQAATHGYKSNGLTLKAVQEKYPFIQPHYAVEARFYPADMSAEPSQFIHRFLQYLQQQLGVTVLFNQTVIDCAETNQAVQARTSNGNIFEAELAIICSGYVGNLLFPSELSSLGVIVSKLQMMQTVPLPTVSLQSNILTGLTIRRYEAFQAVAAQNPTPPTANYAELVHWGIHLLFKQGADGSIIIGDSHEYAPIDAQTTLGSHSDTYINDLILNEAERIVRFSVRNLEKLWAGFYAQHPQEMVAYAISPRIHIRTGIGGKGMSSGAGYAEASIRQLLG